MAEEEKEEQEEEGKKKKGGSLVLILIIVLLFMVLAIGGVIAYIMLSGGEESASSGEVHQEKSVKRSQHADDLTVGPMYPLDKFTVNLMSESGRRYLVATVNLELDSDKLTSELDAKTALIRDIVITILSSKTVEEITTAKGKEKLKEEMVGAMNRRLEDGYVKRIYFTQFMIQ